MTDIWLMHTKDCQVLDVIICIFAVAAGIAGIMGIFWLYKNFD